MSVLSYLQKRASDAVLSSAETGSIATSIATLQKRLDAWFRDSVTERFQFGSSTRGTILPRKMDALSDIDYMVVFADGGYTPQTYLDRLKRFAEAYYSSSEILQAGDPLRSARSLSRLRPHILAASTLMAVTTAERQATITAIDPP
jgi:predicted nucleotidyltransferase